MKYILIFLTFLLAQTVFACSFGPDANIFKSQEENYANYSHILSVTIANKQELEEFVGTEYTLTVHKAHKGSAGNTVVVTSPGHSCGFFGEVGSSFLWFTNGTEEIDETTPKYNFETSAEASEAGNILVGPVKEQACTKDYRPVCASLPVQCITTPCPPIPQTFSNSCVAENAGATNLYEGECKNSIENTNTEEPQVVSEENQNGPQSSPQESFTPPTTPPPYNTEAKKPVQTPEKSMWVSVANFFKSWLVWW